MLTHKSGPHLHISSAEAVNSDPTYSQAPVVSCDGVMGAANRYRGLLSRMYPLLTELWQLLDAAAVAATLFGLAWAHGIPYSQKYLILSVLTAVLMGSVYSWSDLFYRLRSRTMAQETDRLLRAWASVLALLLVVKYLANETGVFPRTIMVEWAIVGFLAQFLIHAAVRRTLHFARRHGLNLRRAIVIGCGQPLERFVNFLDHTPWLGIKVEGYLAEPHWFTPASVDDAQGFGTNGFQGWAKYDSSTRKPTTSRAGAESREPAVQALRHLGSLKDLEPLVTNLSLSEIYVTLPLDRSADAEAALRMLINVPVNVNWIPDFSLTQVLSTRTDTLVEQPLILLSDSRIDRHGRLVKRLEDLVLGGVLLAVLSPLMLLIACAVKLSSPGPVLYRQARRGLSGQSTVVWKFRSMRISPKADIAKQATLGDSRITPIGRWLRRWSLDELPQLLNVVQGRMSLVGPRPHPLWLDDKFANTVEAYMQRHRVKPGLTGWAQVHGFRGETDTPEKMEGRLRHDLYYITHWSPLLDAKILAATLPAVVSGKNAY